MSDTLKLEDSTLDMLLDMPGPIEGIIREAYEWGFADGYHVGASDQIYGTPERRSPGKRKMEELYADHDA